MFLQPTQIVQRLLESSRVVLHRPGLVPGALRLRPTHRAQQRLQRRPAQGRAQRDPALRGTGQGFGFASGHLEDIGKTGKEKKDKGNLIAMASDLSDLLAMASMMASNLVMMTDGLQPNSNGLQPTCDGLQPTKEKGNRYTILIQITLTKLELELTSPLIYLTPMKLLMDCLDDSGGN